MTYHFYSSFPVKDPETFRRQSLAEKTWDLQDWEELPIYDEVLPRMFDERGRKFPYLKDVFDSAFKRTRSGSDILVYTNADICVSTDCSKRIEAHLENRGACYAFRRDFGRLEAPIPDSSIQQGENYPGTDLFAFRASWWADNGRYFPDMILGREAFDPVMRVLMENTNHLKPLSLPNLIYHERHGAPTGSVYWEDPRHRYTLPGQLHNLRLAYDWLPRNGYKPENFGIRRV